MRIAYVTDRLSQRSGADLHLLDVIRWMATRHSVIVAAGRLEATLPQQRGVEIVRVRGLANPIDSAQRLGRLDDVLAQADVVHVQNVMNPTAIRRAVATSRAVFTIQDHRLFCPGPGRTLPDGQRCNQPMSDAVCGICLVESDYRRRTLVLTEARCNAVRGARLIVLSNYMAQQLAQAGLVDAQVIGPPIETPQGPSPAGRGVVFAGRIVHHKGADWAHRFAWVGGYASKRIGAGQFLREFQYLFS